MKDFLTSKVKITINCLNQELIFDKLIKNNISITKLIRKNNFESSFFIENKNYDKTLNILQKFNAQICEEKFFGLKLIKKNLFKRMGICFALLCIIIFFALSNFFVIETKIVGNSILQSSQINNFLIKNYDFNKFTLKKLINTTQIELDLLNSFNEISMANVMIKGNTLVINIKEKSEAEILREQNQNLVSDFNGRILEFSLISGTANVKVGDIVKKGDVLVSNFQNNTEGSVPAKAKITAEVWIEKNCTHNSCEIVTIKTGKQQKNTVISFLGINIYNNKTVCRFEKFDKVCSTSKLKNTILPLKVETTTYFEVEDKEIKTNYQNEREKLLAQCKQNALHDLLQDDIIKNEKVIENTLGNTTTLTYLLVVERHL